MPATAQDLIRRYDHLAGERGTWESVWQQIADTIRGRRDFTRQFVTGGRNRAIELFDTTAALASEMLASALHGLLTNMATEWFKLGLEDRRLLEDREVALWTDDAEDVMYTSYQRPRAGFATNIHEYYIDIVNFGNANYFVEEVVGFGPRFQSVPLRESFICEGPDGSVEQVYRCRPVSHRNAVKMWGGRVPKAQKALAEGKASETSDYLHIVTPNDDPDSKLVPQSRMRGRQFSRMPFVAYWVDLHAKQILSVGGYEEMPYMFGRWSKDPGEVYGRGPGHMAVVDQAMCHQMMKNVIQHAQMAVRPPLQVTDDGVIGKPKYFPGGITTVRDNGTGRDPIKPFELGGNPNLGMEMIRGTRAQIQSHFFWQLLEVVAAPGVTATQTLEIAQRAQRLLAPVLDRLQNELLEPLNSRTFGILDRGGFFLPRPPLIEDAHLRVDYISPVARAQKASDVQAILDFGQIAMNFGQVDRDALKTANWDEMLRSIAEAQSVPPRNVRSREEVEAMKDAERAMMAEEAQRQAELQAAEAIGKASPALRLLQGGAAA